RGVIAGIDWRTRLVAVGAVGAGAARQAGAWRGDRNGRSSSAVQPVSNVVRTGHDVVRAAAATTTGCAVRHPATATAVVAAPTTTGGHNYTRLQRRDRART